MPTPTLGGMTRPLVARLAALCSMGALLVACESRAPSPGPPGPTQVAASTASAQVEVISRQPGVKRLVAIGDLHGDLAATRAALRLAGVVDATDRWVGGKTVVVQTGDFLDRGDQERAIIDLLERLRKEARTAGGAVHVLHGNHELMNVAGDLRYVSPSGFREFADRAAAVRGDPSVARVPEQQLGRFAAFRPGGSYARKLADHPVVLVVGDTVFVHGGLLPKHVRYGIDRMNREVAAWLLGQSAVGARLVSTRDSPVWVRHYADRPDEADCRMLGETLALLKAARMVAGHTTKSTITPACNEQIWLIDVGMAAYAGGKPEVLEITAKAVRPLRQEP